MKKTTMAAMLALAGAGFLPTAAGAAVFQPADGAMRDVARSGAIHAQFSGGNRPQRPAVRQAPIRRAAPVARQPQRVVRPSVGKRPGNITAGPGRGVRPGVVTRGPRPGFRPGAVGSKGVVVHRRGYRPAGYRVWHPRHLVVRRWHRRPYYGTIIGGIAIGTILAASAYYAYAAEPPAPGLCWFWADPEETQGYWDYCVDP